MADCCTMAGDFGQAQRLYSDAVGCQPQRAEAYVGLGAVAMADGRTGDARRYFQLARELDCRCPQAYAGLALIYHDDRQYPAAFDMYLRCLDLNSDHLLALLGLFQVSCQMGTFAMITRYLKLYLRRHPDDTAVLFCLATLHARGGSLKAAREAALRVLALEPTHTEAVLLLQQIEQTIAPGPAGERPDEPTS
jgi:Flp pilus assembly protein TadD